MLLNHNSVYERYSMKGPRFLTAALFCHSERSEESPCLSFDMKYLLIKIRYMFTNELRV